MNRSFIPFVLCVGLCVSAAAHAAPQPPNPVVAWHADPAQVSSLGPEVTVQNYVLRLPAPLTAVPVSPDVLARLSLQGITPCLYGLVRPDGTREAVEIIIGAPTPKDVSVITRDQIMQLLLAQAAQRINKLTHKKPTFGNVNGLSFERVTFTGIGTGIVYGKRVHGIGLVADDNKTLVSITIADTEPYSTASLPTAEAAALTFHKNFHKK